MLRRDWRQAFRMEQPLAYRMARGWALRKERQLDQPALLPQRVQGLGLLQGLRQVLRQELLQVRLVARPVQMAEFRP